MSFWQLYSIPIIFSFRERSFFCFFFCSFVLFLQDCQFLMRVRVCCLASAWLAPLGRRFREAEMSVVDSWSLFPCFLSADEQAPLLLPWFQGSGYGTAPFSQWCGVTLLSGQGRCPGTHSPSLFFLMEYKKTCQSSRVTPGAVTWGEGTQWSQIFFIVNGKAVPSSF